MINILNLDHLVLTVKDIEETVKFYEKLGMKKANDVMEYNHIEWTPFTVK